MGRKKKEEVQEEEGKVEGGNVEGGKYEVKMISVDNISPNPLNPNKMGADKFNRLVEDIVEHGFVENLQVAPLGDGKYELIGGEHRWQAAKLADMKEVPCVVLDWDQQKRNAYMVYLNITKGKIDPEKFTKLFVELQDSGQEEDAIRYMMGITNENEFAKLFKEVKSKLPKQMQEKLEEAKEEIKTVDDLSNVLNKLFTEFGDTVDHNYMFFTWGGKKHVMIQCDKELWEEIQKVCKAVEVNNTDAIAAWKDIVSGWEEVFIVKE